MNFYFIGLETFCELKGTPLLWLRFYLPDRNQMIISGDPRDSVGPSHIGSSSAFCPRPSSIYLIHRWHSLTLSTSFGRLFAYYTTPSARSRCSQIEALYQ